MTLECQTVSHLSALLSQRQCVGRNPIVSDPLGT
jgi:hypothetical protein